MMYKQLKIKRLKTFVRFIYLLAGASIIARAGYVIYQVSTQEGIPVSGLDAVCIAAGIMLTMALFVVVGIWAFNEKK